MHTQTEPAIATSGRPSAAGQPPLSPDNPATDRAQSEAEVVLDDLLVEDVSIDGMCGVY